MIVNPFTYGDPISSPTRFFGRQLEIEQVFSRLRNNEFESSSLVGERRIGKTSLLNYIADPAVRQRYELHTGKYFFVTVDLQMVNKDTNPTRLWQRLLREMAKSCQDAEVKQMLVEMRQSEQIDTFALDDVFDIVDEKDLYVALLMDEFEKVTENPNFDPAFFFGLRSLAIHHNLSLITSSRRELIELSHSEAIRSSPFFNIFANINLRLFTGTEAQHLIAQLLEGTGVSFTDTELSLIFTIAGCHPYFLQAACYFLFEAYSRGLSPDDRIAFLRKKYREEATPHFDDYWLNSYEQEKIVLTALALLRQQQKRVDGRTFSVGKLQELYNRSEQTLGHLEKRGLVVNESDTYSLVNSSFGDWIYGEITDTMRDQQSYKDWLAANRGVMERLSEKGKNELGEILPRIGANYREIIVSWVSDPRNLLIVAGLLKTVLGFG